MSESNLPAPSEKAPQGPALALKAFASRLESGPAPDLGDLGDALALIDPAELDKTHRKLLDEAEAKVDGGQMPDSLALRMLAKALATPIAVPAERPAPTTTAAAPLIREATAEEMEPPRRGRPPGSKNKPKLLEEAVQPEWDTADGAAPANGEDTLGAVLALSTKPIDSGKVIMDQLSAAIDYSDETDEPAETDGDLVARAAEVVERSDGALAGSLYELADRLNKQPLDPAATSDLINRTHAAVEREIKIAIDTGKPLPSFAVDWLRLRAI